jgi:hypothetical protein
MLVFLMANVMYGTVSAEDTLPPSLQRDPFKRPSLAPVANARSAGTENPVLDLRGVIYDSRQPLANIDGQIVGIGDFIEEYRLVKVGEREATLVKNGKRITLKLDRTPSQ